jgi:branched-chain amino acid transport system permease protein
MTMEIILVMLFNGLAYGVLLFTMAVGMSVTMGMMRFVNLSQVSLSMLGGYVVAVGMQHFGLPYVATLPLCFILIAALTMVLERLVFRHFYNADDLTQVLLTIGLLFMSIASAAYIWGASFMGVQLPPWLSGQTPVLGLMLERYRMFLVCSGILLALMLYFGIERTRFGATVRACVDNRRASSGCGINTSRVFALTFAIGGGMAGLGGALAVGQLIIDPNFPLRYLVYVLVVVSVGGLGNITGTLLASMLIGVADVFGKYYVPQAGSFLIYLLTVLIMLWRPEGLIGHKGTR